MWHPDYLKQKPKMLPNVFGVSLDQITEEGRMDVCISRRTMHWNAGYGIQ
jgi:hypothetical protein